MLRSLALGMIVVSTSVVCLAQAKSNDEIARQIKALKAEKTIFVEFDAGSKTSKIKAISDNFLEKETGKAGLQAMNFAMGFFYAGNALQNSPDRILLSLWVLSKKPRFADNHRLIIELGGEAIDLGDARYVSKPRENMEYLNYEISLPDLGSVGRSGNVGFRIGSQRFTVIPEQMRLLKNLARIADTKVTN